VTDGPQPGLTPQRRQIVSRMRAADEAATRESARRRRVPLLLVLLLTALALTLPWMLGAVPHSWRSETDVCRHCGLERRASRSRLGGVLYDETVTTVGTAVSEALDRSGACEHDWFPVRFAATSGSALRAKEMAHGGTRFRIIHLLLIDDSFAEELADMPDPPQVWFDLLAAAEASPEQVDARVGAWWEEPDREPFAEWWHGNSSTLLRRGRPTPRSGKL